MDWDETFDEISSGRVGYALYGLLKTAAYWIITVFALGLIGNLLTFIIFGKAGLFGGFVWALFSILIVYLILRNDLSRRYNEIRSLDRMSKTALATSTGLAYVKLVKYLAWMSEKGFVEVDANGAVVLTKAGAEAYNELVQWIMKYVGQLKFPRLRLRT